MSRKLLCRSILHQIQPSPKWVCFSKTPCFAPSASPKSIIENISFDVKEQGAQAPPHYYHCLMIIQIILFNTLQFFSMADIKPRQGEFIGRTRPARLEPRPTSASVGRGSSRAIGLVALKNGFAPGCAKGNKSGLTGGLARRHDASLAWTAI